MSFLAFAYLALLSLVVLWSVSRAVRALASWVMRHDADRDARRAAARFSLKG